MQFRQDIKHKVLSALLEIRYDGFSSGFMRDSNSGCGRQNNEAEWPTLRARRNERWTRPFGQFLGLNKLYPVIVMPPF